MWPSRTYDGGKVTILDLFNSNEVSVEEMDSVMADLGYEVGKANYYYFLKSGSSLGDGSLVCTTLVRPQRVEVRCSKSLELKLIDESENKAHENAAHESETGVNENTDTGNVLVDAVNTFEERDVEFKGLGETLEDKVLLRKLLNSVPNKFLPIVATIEQYQDLDEMSFEEAIRRLTAYEERIKSQDTLEANDQDKLLMASSKTYGKWRGKDFNKEGKESMKWKNNPNARRASTSQGTKDKSKLRCYECGEHEHFAK
nr:zinc finger, CCHC-type [Tanacetum cinerariifolium]